MTRKQATGQMEHGASRRFNLASMNDHTKYSMNRKSGRLVKTLGEGFRVPSLGRRYVNLDNAATTPVAVPVMQAVTQALNLYGSIHRGSGIKSVISTEIYERSLAKIAQFVGARADDIVVLASNSTTVINRFADSYDFAPGDVVLISEMEHSSNDLPWRNHASVKRVTSLPSGDMDINNLESTLKRLGSRVRLVSVTGASNVTGYLAPIPEIAKLVHRYGAELFVDAAQLMAHRPIRLRASSGGEDDIDYVAFSGHKMYAPFGVGVLVGRRKAFERIPPDIPGGGTVEMITADDQVWAQLPARINPGSPNVIGVVAVAAAMKMIQTIGFDRIRVHESALVKTGLEMFSEIPDLTLHGQSVFRKGDDRLPLFPFTVNSFPYAKVAAILGHEYGIAVRQGHLCQHQFMKRVLGISAAEQAMIEVDLRRGDRTSRYGMVRASCGLCTSSSDLLQLGNALKSIVAGGITCEYRHDPATGEYLPVGSQEIRETDIPNALKFLYDQ